MNILEKIASQLVGINENDLQKAERNIAKTLIKAGYLERIEKPFGFVYKAVDRNTTGTLTYRKLAERILAMDSEKLDSNVSVLALNEDEVFPVIDFVDDDWAATDVPDEQDSDYFARGINQVAGVLDDGHPFLTIAN